MKILFKKTKFIHWFWNDWFTSRVNLPDFLVSYNVNIHRTRSSSDPRHNVDKQIRKSSNVTQPDERKSNVPKIRWAYDDVSANGKNCP